MNNEKSSFWLKFNNVLRNYAWLIAFSLGIFAILFLLLPIINYEIREEIYSVATGERISKIDYVYQMNLISYFTTEFKLNFTMYITISLIFIASLLAILSKFKKELFTISGVVYLLSVCMFILVKEFFRSGENAVMDYAKVIAQESAEQTVSASLHDVSLSWGSALGIAMCTMGFAITTLPHSRYTTKQIAEEGVFIALAFVLNFIKIPIGPTGGSINFQMLPLMIIALRHGPAHGFVAGGLVYGLLTCLTDGYGFACYPFDYLIGFGSVAVMGLFQKFIFSENQRTYNFKGLAFIFLSGTIATSIRYIGSNTSSMVVYGYTLQAALIYNAFYIPLSGLISIIA